jgi:metal-sulfur cluster biosynthetic enzyme
MDENNTNNQEYNVDMDLPDNTYDKESVKTQVGDVFLDISDLDEKLESQIWDALHSVYDPDLGIDIVNLGLVYDVRADKSKNAVIDITLTTPACPLTDMIEGEIVGALEGIVLRFKLNWVWSPPWSLDRITEEGRAELQSLGMNF